MTFKTLAALIAITTAGVVAAQERPASDYGAYGGELRMLAKAPQSMSGSLGLSFGGNGFKGYEGSFGGTLAKDRMWFFASAQRNEGSWFASQNAVVPQSSQGFSGKVDAQLGDRQSFSASAFSRQGSFTATPMSPALELPSSFLSLHYTGVVSSNMLFTATVSRGSSGTNP